MHAYNASKGKQLAELLLLLQHAISCGFLCQTSNNSNTDNNSSISKMNESLAPIVVWLWVTVAKATWPNFRLVSPKNHTRASQVGTLLPLPALQWRHQMHLHKYSTMPRGDDIALKRKGKPKRKWEIIICSVSSIPAILRLNNLSHSACSVL